MSGDKEDKEQVFKIVFDGTDKNWNNFYDKFKAYGECKKWWGALEAPMQDDDTEEKKQARKKAMYALTMCTSGDAAKYVRAYKRDPYL